VASAISHAAAALAIGACFYPKSISGRSLIGGAFCAVLPDVDVIGFRFGIQYQDVLGHLGFSHSFLFAAALAWVVTLVIVRFGGPVRRWRMLFGYVFLSAASHGILDALTDGGLGVAFFSPVINDRYFFPWRPIRVSPIGVSRFFTERGLEVLKSELVWIWIPSAMLVMIARWLPGRSYRVMSQ
jgi:inner membrane protein